VRPARLSIFVGFVSQAGARVKREISIVAAPGEGFALGSIGFVSRRAFGAFRDRVVVSPRSLN